MRVIIVDILFINSVELLSLIMQFLDMMFLSSISSSSSAIA